jgi:hypothetical protein
VKSGRACSRTGLGATIFQFLQRLLLKPAPGRSSLVDDFYLDLERFIF